MDEINVIFRGSLSIASKTQEKKFKRETSLPQRIEPERRMKWSETDISFRHEDHPEIELSNQNLPLVVKLLIGRHKVAKTLIDNGASLILIMTKTFIEMGLNLADLTLINDTFHDVIPGQSSTLIERIDLEVSCRSGDNKRREMLAFEVISFDIGYNCILERPFLLMFMAVIHTAYATMKMTRQEGVITVKADQRDALSCENTSLLLAGRFGDKEGQEQATKAAKTKGGSTPSKASTPKPPTSNILRVPPASKDTNITSASTPAPADQKVDNKLKGSVGIEDKEVLVDPSNSDKKFRISSNLDPK
jgi:hypothetical protein